MIGSLLFPSLPETTPVKSFGPGLREWLFLAGSGAFTAAGLAMVALSDAGERHMAVASTAFFGLCTAIFAFFTWEKVRLARSAATDGIVEAAQGRIHTARSRVYAMGVALVVVGVLLATVPGIPWVPFLASVAIALAGLGVLVGTTSGRMGHAWLQFEATGLRVGDRHGSFVLPWDDLAGCALWEHQQNPVVVVQLRDVRRAIASAEPQSRAATVAATLSGGTFQILPLSFGLDAVLLARSIHTYVSDPARRDSLARPLLPPP